MAVVFFAMTGGRTRNPARGEAPRVCVYTTLIGHYEKLNEQPVALESSIPFLCLTDDLNQQSKSWHIRHVSPVFGMDPVRSQRDLKLRPHAYLPEFDASLYIDNSVLLRDVPEHLFARCSSASGFSLPQHSFRESVLDEFLAVAKLGFDDQNRIFEQLNHYLLDYPSVLQEIPYWTGVMVRDHRSPAVCKLLDIWSAHVNRYSRRDQLSINVALKLSSVTPDVIGIDNHASWFHSWPHAEGRDREKGGSNPAQSLIPPIGRIRELERSLSDQAKRHEQEVAELKQQHSQEIADLERQHGQKIVDIEQQRQLEFAEQSKKLELLTSSRTWRFASAVSRLSNRYPTLAVMIWRGLGLLRQLATFERNRRSPASISKQSPGLAESPRTSSASESSA